MKDARREKARQRAKALVDKMTVSEMISSLRYDSPAIKRLGIPEYNWWNEGLHGAARSGTATVFPQAIGLASMFDKHFMETPPSREQNIMLSQNKETEEYIKALPSGLQTSTYSVIPDGAGGKRHMEKIHI